jgi:hypothetical protein
MPPYRRSLTFDRSRVQCATPLSSIRLTGSARRLHPYHQRPQPPSSALPVRRKISRCLHLGLCRERPGRLAGPHRAPAPGITHPDRVMSPGFGFVSGGAIASSSRSQVPGQIRSPSVQPLTASRNSNGVANSSLLAESRTRRIPVHPNKRPSARRKSAGGHCSTAATWLPFRQTA